MSALLPSPAVHSLPGTWLLWVLPKAESVYSVPFLSFLPVHDFSLRPVSILFHIFQFSIFPSRYPRPFMQTLYYRCSFVSCIRTDTHIYTLSRAFLPLFRSSHPPLLSHHQTASFFTLFAILVFLPLSLTLLFLHAALCGIAFPLEVASLLPTISLATCFPFAGSRLFL